MISLRVGQENRAGEVVCKCPGMSACFHGNPYDMIELPEQEKLQDRTAALFLSWDGQGRQKARPMGTPKKR